MPIEEQSFIEEIFRQRANNDANTRTLANTVRSLINDTLSGDKYLGELLQNADDGHSPMVEFILAGQYLIFKHAGNHFDENDIKAICDSASPDRSKINASDQIGNKGIGFKAVFSIASTVIILSKKYTFCFDESYPGWQGNANNYPWQIIPIWTDRETLPEQVKKHCNTEHVHFIFRLKNDVINTISENLNALRARHLLFLRHVKRISIVLDEAQDKSKEIILQTPERILHLPEKNDDFSIQQIKINLNDTWYLYQTDCLIPNSLLEQIRDTSHIPAKYKTWRSIPISISVYMRNNELIPIAVGQKVFCYLSTDLEFGLNFIINAEFLLDSSRKQLRTDNIASAWNGFILENIVYEQIRFLSILNLRSPTWASIFNIISKPDKIPEPFKARCKQAFEEACKEFELITNFSESTVYQINKSVVDAHGFIAKFGNEELKKNCVSPKTKNTALVVELGATRFQSTEIIQKMTEPWLLKKIQAPNMNKQFLEFISNLYSRLNEPAKSKFKEAFRLGKYILSNHDQLEKPSDVYFPDETLKYLLSNFNFVKLVHAVLFRSTQELIKWLADSGVKTLKLEHIITQANKSETELVAFTLRIAAKNLEQYSETEKNQFKKLQVKSRGNQLVEPKQCYLPNVLNPELQIEQFIENSSDLLLHIDYIEIVNAAAKVRNKKDFLTMLGVQQNITLGNVSLIVEAVNKCSDANKVIRFTQFIFSQFFSGKNPEAKKDCLKAVKSLKIITKQQEILSANACYLANLYNPKLALEELVAELSYVSECYHTDELQGEEWKSFFLQLGVREEVSVEVHRDAKREELIRVDPLAKQYFQYLEETTINGALYPPATSSYMHQHKLYGGYVQIDFAKILFATPLFWHLLIEHWTKFHDVIKAVTYNTAKSEKNIPSNIHYLVHQAIKQAYGSDSQVADYYGYDIQKQLGVYTPSDFSIAEITQDLNAEQLNILGFKAYLPLDICQSLLNTIAEADNYAEDSSKIIFIFEHILWRKKQGSEFTFANDLLLPNQLGKYSPASSLYYIIDDCLPHIKNAHLVKKPANFSPEQFQKLCQLLNITQIAYEELIPEAQNNLEPELEEHVGKRMLYVIYLEAAQHDYTGDKLKFFGMKFYYDLVNKLKKFNDVCAEQIKITYSEILAVPVDLWINESEKTIYHCPLEDLDIDDQRKLYEFLYTYLDVSCPKDDFISIMTLSFSRLEKKYQSYLGDYLIDDFKKLSAKREAEEDTGDANEFSRSKRFRQALDDAYNVDTSSTSENATCQQAAVVLPATSRLSLATSSSGPSATSSEMLIPALYQEVSGTQRSSVERTHQKAFSQGQGGFFSDRLSKVQRQEVGDRGEKAVYNYLREKYRQKYGEEAIVDCEGGFKISKENYEKTVCWPNKRYDDLDENYASCLPYDFEITVTKQGRQKIRHLEVKTSTSENDTFEISYSNNEWQQMTADEQQVNRSHRLFIVKTRITAEGKLEIDGSPIKKNLTTEITNGRATAIPYMRVQLTL